MTPKPSRLNEEAKRKRALARASKRIREKYAALKLNRSAAELEFEKTLAPIVDPLKALVNNGGIKRQIDEVLDSRDEVDDSNTPVLSSTPNTVGVRKQKKRLTASPVTHHDEEEGEEDVQFQELETIAATNDAETTMQSILETPEGHEFANDYIKKFFGELGGKYFHELIYDTKKSDDPVYGIRFVHGKWMIGNSNIEINKKNDVLINGVRYAGTPGLFELIFKRAPNDAIYNEDDEEKYKAILLATNAHRRGYDAKNQLNGNRSPKWRGIIAPLLAKPSAPSLPQIPKTLVGHGLNPEEMVVTDNPIEYVYWDSLDELVNRLRLIVASTAAGHNNLDNEFANIVEELREAEVIE